MKRTIICLLAFMTSLNPELVKAQEKLKEGKAIFSFSYPDVEGINEHLLSVATAVKSVTVYFKNGKSRIEYNNESNSPVIIDPIRKERIGLKDSIATIMTFDETQKNQARMFGDTIALITNETKLIAGFKCIKAIYTYPVWQKQPRTMEIWFTRDIAATNFKYSFKGIDGFIMEYTFLGILHPYGEDVDFREIMTCTNVDKLKVSDDVFKVPSGYKVETWEELSKHIKVENH